MGKLPSGKGKAPDLPCVLVIGCRPGTAVGGLTRSGLSLDGPKLETEVKIN